MKDQAAIFAIEFSEEPTPSARIRANKEARKRKWGALMHGRRYYACPACKGDDNASSPDFCQPCEGTGVAASAPYWDRA